MRIILLIFSLLISSCNNEAFAVETPARNISVNTTNFTKNLNNTDTDVQTALQTLDQLDASINWYSLPGYQTGYLLTATGSGIGAAWQATYVNPAITSFTNSVNIIENGSTVNSVVLNWTYNKTMTTASLNNGIGAISPVLLTYTYATPFTTNKTFTLTAGDGINTVSSSTSVSFENKNYNGASTNPSSSITDGQIIGLSSGFATSRNMNFSVSPANQYIIIAYPAAYGAATITVNGFLDNSYNLTTRNFVNSSGATVSYNIYSSANLLTGTYMVVVS